MGFLPILLAFNKNSKSTPIRIVITPNRNGIAKERNTQNSHEFINDDDNENIKSSFSYNDTIREYELNLLSSTKITLQHLLSILPSYADVKDGFGRIYLHPETALSALIFVYKNYDDNLPTLNVENAIRDKNNEPILFPAVYSSSSYGQKDLPKVFEYSLSKSSKFYEEYYTKEDKIPSVRVNMVNNILCSAYVDDIGIHEMRNSIFSYFINAYDNHGKILKTLHPPLNNPENIHTIDDLLDATSQLSSSQFDVFLKNLSKILRYSNYTGY